MTKNNPVDFTEDDSPKRVPLAERQKQPSATFNPTNDSRGGGVTVTPHTGQMPKIVFSSQIEQCLRENPGGSTQSTQVDSDELQDTRSNAGAVSESIFSNPNPEAPNKTAQRHLLIPGISAHTSKFRKKVRFNVAAKPEDDKLKKPSTKKQKLTFRGLINRGWIPNQHGAYVMIFMPAIVAMHLTGFRFNQLLFLLLWIISYFTLFAFARWRKSGGKEKYFPPVKTYGILSTVLIAVSIILMPPLLPWAIPFIPLIAITFCEAYNRRSESLLARSSAVIAAGLSGLVQYDIGVNFWHPYHVPFWPGHEQTEIEPNWAFNSLGTLHGWNWALLVMAYLTLYFWSTIVFVKSCAREKNSFGHYLLSVSSHAAILMIFIAFAALRLAPWTIILVGLILSLRSILLPLWLKQYPKSLSLKHIGMVELIVSIVVIAAVFV